MNKKALMSLCIVVELMILILASIKAFKPNTPLNVNYDSWEHITSDTQGIVSPYFFIDKGSYLAKIKYSSEEDGSISVYSHGDNSYNLREYNTQIHSQKNQEMFEFESTGPSDNTQISLSFPLECECEISDITLYQTRNVEKRQFTILLFLFVVLDLFISCKEFFIKHKIILFGVLAIGFMSSLPLFSYGTEIGHDLDFHLMRIEGICMELSAGHFPVRMQSYYNYGYGYPVSIYYGDILLYFPAILRILGFTSIQAYKIYAFTINTFTALLCFIAGKKIWKKDSIAFFFSAAFTLSTYRFVDIYVRNAVGEYTAMMFFPIIALGVYELYFNTPSNYNKKLNLRALIYISLGMSGIITCHILTTEMVCIFLLVFAIIFIKRTIQKPVILTILASVGSTGLLVLWFIVPFIDYYLNMTVNINVTANKIAHIQSDGAYLTQYFAFFKSVFGARSELITERVSVTPGLLLMLTLAISIGLWLYNISNIIIKRLTVAVLFILLIASNVFPWNYISSNAIGNILSQIQFPWRWLMFACLLMAFLLGYLLEYIEKHYDARINKFMLYGSLLLVLFVQVGFDTSSYSNDAINITAPQYSTDLDGTDYREYFRYGSDFSSLTFDISGDTLVDGELIERKGSDFEFYIKTDKKGKVILPILNYKGYTVTDDTNHSYIITDGPQKEVAITLPENFDGKIYVSFIEPFYWRLVEFISLITICTFIYYVLKNHNQ